MKIHHIALITDDLLEARNFFESWGLIARDIQIVGERYPGFPTHQYKGMGVAGNPSLWIMQPIGLGGPLWEFLKRRGKGTHFHHIAFEVEDMALEYVVLHSSGVVFLRDPFRFENDREIRALFFDGHGTLIELVQTF